MIVDIETEEDENRAVGPDSNKVLIYSLPVSSCQRLRRTKEAVAFFLPYFSEVLQAYFLLH